MSEKNDLASLAEGEVEEGYAKCSQCGMTRDQDLCTDCNGKMARKFAPPYEHIEFKTVLPRTKIEDAVLDKVLETSPQAAALMMREIVCEQVFRQFAKADAEHPCRSLGIREITPAEIVPYALKVYLQLDRPTMRQVAGEVYDRILKDREHPFHWCACAGEQEHDDCVTCGKPIKMEKTS